MSVINVQRRIGNYFTRPLVVLFQWVAKTASYTITKNDQGRQFTNSGAAGAVTFTLPSPIEGRPIIFTKVTKTQNLIVTASGTAKIRGAAGEGVTLTNSTNTEHGSLTLVPDGTNWYILAREGTWALS